MPDISDILIARVIFLILASNVYYGSGHGNNKTIPPKMHKQEKYFRFKFMRRQVKKASAAGKIMLIRQFIRSEAIVCYLPWRNW